MILALSTPCYYPNSRKTNFNFSQFYFEKKEEIDRSLTIYHSALTESLKNLGKHHILTGQLFFDTGEVFLKLGKKEDAILMMEKGFTIIDHIEDVKTNFKP